MAAREVTVDQFRRFQQYLAARPDLTKTNPWLSWRHYEEYSPEGRCAAITVSWYQAAAFCRWLSEQEGVPDGEMCYPELEAIQPGRLTMPRGHLGRTYRLPTEAEWEYACRAGTAGRRPFGSADELLPRYAWMLRNGEGCSQPVGRLRPNDLGLFDMIGNVWEWCQDRHRDYPAGTQERPAADEEDGERVIDNEAARMLRGGSSVDGPKLLRSAVRCDYPPDSRDCTVGFRLACTWRETR